MDFTNKYSRLNFLSSLSFLLIISLLPIQAFTQVQLGDDLQGRAEYSHFGSGVTISADGNIVAVSGTENSEMNPYRAGYVQVYKWDGDQWSEMGAVIAEGEHRSRFGTAIALSNNGQIIAISAPSSRNTDCEPSPFGSVWIYKWENDEWTLMGEPIYCLANMSYGRISLSADGSVLGIGILGENSSAQIEGFVRVMKWDGSTWQQLGDDFGPIHPKFYLGRDVKLSADGNTLAFSAPGTISNFQTNNEIGFVCVYNWDGDNWQIKGDTITTGEKSVHFGSNIGLSADGNTLVAGISGKENANGGIGECNVYRWNGGKWVQRGFTISGRVYDQSFGYSVDMSADGDIFAVSSVGGFQRGYVRIFQWDGQNYVLFGKEINSGNWGDNYGYRLALDSAGNRLIVAAITDLGNGQNAGAAKVYDLSSITGVNNPRLNTDIGITPNPTAGEIRIMTEEALTTYILYNVSGQVIKRGQLDISSGDSGQLSIHDVDSGIYFLQFIGPKGHGVKRVVKN